MHAGEHDVAPLAVIVLQFFIDRSEGEFPHHSVESKPQLVKPYQGEPLNGR